VDANQLAKLFESLKAASKAKAAKGKAAKEGSLTIVPGEAKAKVGRGTMCMVWCDCLTVWPPCPRYVHAAVV